MGSRVVVPALVVVSRDLAVVVVVEAAVVVPGFGVLMAGGHTVAAAVDAVVGVGVALVAAVRGLRRDRAAADAAATPTPAPDWTDAQLAVLHSTPTPTPDPELDPVVVTAVIPVAAPVDEVVRPPSVVWPPANPESGGTAGEPVLVVPGSWDDLNAQLDAAFNDLDAWLRHRYVDATGVITAIHAIHHTHDDRTGDQ